GGHADRRHRQPGRRERIGGADRQCSPTDRRARRGELRRWHHRDGAVHRTRGASSMSADVLPSTPGRAWTVAAVPAPSKRRSAGPRRRTAEPTHRGTDAPAEPTAGTDAPAEPTAGTDRRDRPP